VGCSLRYKKILIQGARETQLDEQWISKLEQMPHYVPSEKTLSLRGKLPAISSPPVMTIEELKPYTGQEDKKDQFPPLISSCGYIFQFTENWFHVFHGRDITIRNVLQCRGVNVNTNDKCSVSPFPRLALCWSQRFLSTTLCSTKTDIRSKLALPLLL